MLLACSAAGEKLTPLVIGKALNPRCFRGVDKGLLPVIYRANRKAWMTGLLFKEWLQRLDGKMWSQKRKILLLLDNCGAHPDVQLANVKLVFLPPNTTSRLQPCDAGIIATLKAHYRKRLMRHILAEMDTANTATELGKRVDVLDAIGWLWCSVTPDTITKCFAKCGIVEDDVVADVVAVTDLDEPGEGAERLLGDVSWETYVCMDEATVTTEVTTDDWEAALVAKARGEIVQDDEDSDDDDNEPEGRPLITAKDGLLQIKDVMNFALSENDTAMFEAASTVRDLLQGHSIRQAALAEQKSITDFSAVVMQWL